MQVENLLSRGVSVLLDDGNAVGFGGVFDDDCCLLHYLVNVRDYIVRCFVDVFVVLFWTDKSVPFVEWSDVEKHKHFVVFPDDACGSFSLHYLAENASSILQEYLSPRSHCHQSF